MVAEENRISDGHRESTVSIPLEDPAAFWRVCDVEYDRVLSLDQSNLFIDVCLFNITGEVSTLDEHSTIHSLCALDVKLVGHE